MNIINKFNYNPSDYVVSLDPKSDTVPDLALSPREMLLQFERGTLPSSVQRTRYQTSKEATFLADRDESFDIEEKVQDSFTDMSTLWQLYHDVKNEVDSKKAEIYAAKKKAREDKIRQEIIAQYERSKVGALSDDVKSPVVQST